MRSADGPRDRITGIPMHVDLKLVIELQAVDQNIARVAAEVSYLPKHIAEIEAKLNAALRQLETDQQTLAAHYKERKRLEGEIQILREKISKYKDQTLDVKTNEQYRALQHEIDFAELGIRQFEDQILEKMVLDDDLEAAVKTAQGRLAEEKTVVEKEKEEATARTRVDEEELAALRQRREQIRAQISPEVYRTYAHLMQARKGVAVAEVRDGTCGGCRVLLRPQAFNEVKANDQIRVCENCHRILFYPGPTPPESSADQSLSLGVEG